MIEETVAEYRYPMTVGYVSDLLRRYFRMLGRIGKRRPAQNLTFDQLARWYDLSNDRLGKTRSERCRIRLTIWWNLFSATLVCLLVSCRVKVPVKWSSRLDVLADDFWVDDLINRHQTHPEKVEQFMCLETVLNIPIMVSERDGRYFVEDGNHRHTARKRRGFRKVRGILI